MSEGTGHKIAHNVTTLANIPLVLWFIYTVFSLRSGVYEDFAAWMAQPVNLIAGILFVGVTLKHFVLEIEVVFQDYVSNVSVRHFCIIMMKAFALVLGVSAIVSLLKIAFTAGV